MSAATAIAIERMGLRIVALEAECTRLGEANRVLETKVALERAEAKKAVAWLWRDGEPPFPWKEEWFIAETIHGERVVLRALPKEYSYDYTTADKTFTKAKNIKRWAQFPDSFYIAAPDAAISQSQAQGEAE